MTPKFFFGHKGDVSGNLFFLDNSTVCYPCGHNIVIYSIDDKSQKFIPGTEGSDGITAIALSHNRKQLAVCESSVKAFCSVYNIGKMLETFKEKKSANNVYDQVTIKKKKILCSQDYTAKSFISVDFCQANEKLLVTLGDDCRVTVWQFDKQKCVATELIVLSTTTAVCQQVSFSNTNPDVIVVTGRDVYRYYTLTDTNQLKLSHSGFTRKDESAAAISTNWVRHAWLSDGKFVVCTDIGQILIFEQTGDFKNIQISDPKKQPFAINSVLPFQMGSHQDAPSGSKQQSKSGFVVAGDSGQLRVFFKSEGVQPYKRAEGDDLQMSNQDPQNKDKTLLNDVMYHKITNMALSPRQDTILFTTDAN